MAAAELTVDDVIRELKDTPGFTSYLILNNDGIVIKYENMDYKAALHHSHQVLGLTGKASKYIRDLFEANENEVESIRLKTSLYEMVIAQQGNFTLIAIQAPAVHVPEEEVKEGEEGKEGEEKKE